MLIALSCLPRAIACSSFFFFNRGLSSAFFRGPDNFRRGMAHFIWSNLRFDDAVISLRPPLISIGVSIAGVPVAYGLPLLSFTGCFPTLFFSSRRCCPPGASPRLEFSLSVPDIAGFIWDLFTSGVSFSRRRLCSARRWQHHFLLPWSLSDEIVLGFS